MTWLGLPLAADWRGRRVVIFGLIGYRGEGEANAMNAAARAAIFNLSILPDVFLGDPLQVTAGHADNDGAVHADPVRSVARLRLPSILRWGDPDHAQCALGVLHNPLPHRTIFADYIEVGGKIVGETQTKALSVNHALFAATKRPRPKPSPAPQYAKHIGETVRVLTGPCTGHIGEITAVDGPSPITFRVQFAAPVRCAEVGEVQAVWRQLDQLVFIPESV